MAFKIFPIEKIANFLGLERIQELEQPKNFGLAEVADRECDNPPHFLGNLPDLELHEHDDLHFELKVSHFVAEIISKLTHCYKTKFSNLLFIKLYLLLFILAYSRTRPNDDN